RRLQVGPFLAENAILLEELADLPEKAPIERFLLPIEAALDDIPAVVLTQEEAHRLRCGQPVSIFRRSDRERLETLSALSGNGAQSAPPSGPENEAEPVALATDGNRAVALVRVEGATLHPMRVLNL
ncbi:MAG: tRNA pseudouridine(55) synthase TruB, partial [Pseudomonadota bacterium]